MLCFLRVKERVFRNYEFGLISQTFLDLFNGHDLMTVSRAQHFCDRRWKLSGRHRLHAIVLHHRLQQLHVSFNFLLNDALVLPPSPFNLSTFTVTHTKTHLHPEERDAGQQINGGLQILESLWVSCREIILV